MLINIKWYIRTSRAYGLRLVDALLPLEISQNENTIPVGVYPQVNQVMRLPNIVMALLHL